MKTDVKNYESHLQVTRDGRVYSKPNKGNHFKARELKQSTDSYGYNVVSAKDKTVKVHRLMATTYIPNPNNLPQVNHIDGDKTNNHVINLEWSTPSQQQLHAIAKGLRKDCLNRQKVIQLKDGEVITTYPSLREAERQTNIGWTGISACIRNKRKSAGGYQWVRFNDYPKGVH